MIVQSVQLKNFSCFSDLTAEFSKGFNVIAGINGSGKTSLLKGICDFLYYCTLRIDMPHEFIPYAHISARLQVIQHENLYRFEKQYPLSISIQAKAYDHDLAPTSEWVLTKSNDLDIPQTQGDNFAINGTDIMPLFLFFKANRVWNFNDRSNQFAVVEEKTSRKDAYTNWFDATVDAKALQNWIIVKTLERLESFEQNGLLSGNLTPEEDELSIVNAAIASLLDEAKGLRYDIKNRSTLVEWESKGGIERTPTLLGNLSDGEREVITMIADIARRMCILNPQLGTRVLKETPGIILIDELDLHLHPKWQRSIPKALSAAFPSIQFIVTTHSPQVLSELRPEQIVLLENGRAFHPNVSYGLDSCRILEEIMEAPARPVKIEGKLSRLFLAIENGSLEEARKILDELSLEAPGISEIASAKALIRRREAIGR